MTAMMIEKQDENRRRAKTESQERGNLNIFLVSQSTCLHMFNVHII